MPMTPEELAGLKKKNAAEISFNKYLEGKVEKLRKGLSPKKFDLNDSFKDKEYLSTDEEYCKIMHNINIDKLQKFNYKDFDYEKYIECFKYPKKGTAKDSVMYNPEIYKIFNDEKYKNSIPYVIKEMFGSFRKDNKEDKKKNEDEKRAEHYISKFSKALGLKKDRVKYDLELIWPDLFDENNGKLDSYSALIVSKYLDKDAFEKLAITCKKFKETPEKLSFNPIPLKDKKTRDLFPNLETQYIYSQDDVVFTDKKIKMYHIKSDVRFCRCKGANTLTSIKLYKMKVIYDGCFEGLINLKEVILPEGLSVIEGGVFSGCTSLTNVTIPNGVELMGSSVFSKCTSLKEITLPDSVKVIFDSVFKGCTSLQKITLPKSVSFLDRKVFEGCTSLKEITLPKSTSFRGSIFKGCTSLQKVTIPNGVEIIWSLFEGCTGLKEITIPNSVKEIGSSAFEGCTSLKEITIPNSVKKIGYSTFEGCTSLKEITIPNSLEIGYWDTFKGCINLETVYMKGGELSDELKRIIITQCGHQVNFVRK